MTSTKFLIYTSRAFDRLERCWEAPRLHRTFGTALVVCFLATLALVEMNRLGALPEVLGSHVPRHYMGSIHLAFTLVLAWEVLGLVLTIAHSISTSMGKQFEILSLILLRDVFKELSLAGEPLVWDKITGSITSIVASALGALAIFGVLGLFYKARRRLPITRVEHDRQSFIAAKKVVALSLLACFVSIVLSSAWAYVVRQETEAVFQSFFTLLIFSDIAVVLVSFRYGSSYHVAFRNSGFAVATVVVRLALIAPPVFGALLGTGAALFALGVTLAYNAFVPASRRGGDPGDGQRHAWAGGAS